MGLTIAIHGWLAGVAVGDEQLAKAWRCDPLRLLGASHGDFALAAWDEARRILWLARSPLSSRPLFYRCDPDQSVSLSSLASGLAGSSPRLDFLAVARWYGGLVGTSIEPMYAGVDQVEPGTVVRLDRSGRSTARFWDAGAIEADRNATAQGLAANLREAMEAATADCLGAGGMASLLSAGRDSGVVSAIAAHRLAAEGRSLDCFTSTPGLSRALDADGRLIDEAQGAEEVARRYPNMRHHLVNPSGFRFCEAVERMYRLHSAPLGNPVSLYWWLAIQQQAAAMGCRTILTGGMGNLTISDGGPQYLSDLMGMGRGLRWWKAARKASRFEGTSWLSMADISLGGRIPRPVYALAQRVRGRHRSSAVSHFLKGELGRMVAEVHREEDQRPPRSARTRTQEMLTAMELGDMTPDLAFGVAMRDPTADRRVVEAALAIPPEMLVSPYDRRPIFELAFGDLLPLETVRARRRAYQSMGWNTAYDLGELRSGLDRYFGHRLIGECLDRSAMAEALARWPVGRLPTMEETAEIGDGLLRAFALAAFLFVNFPD